MNLFVYLDELRKNTTDPGAYIRVSHEHEPDPRLLEEIDDNLERTGKFPTEDDRSTSIRWSVEIAAGWADSNRRERTLTITTDRQLNVERVEIEGTPQEYAVATAKVEVGVR